MGEMFQFGEGTYRDTGDLVARGGDQASAAQLVVPILLLEIRFLLPAFWLLILFDVFLALFITFFMLFFFGVLPTYTALRNLYSPGFLVRGLVNLPMLFRKWFMVLGFM
jgi:hypothetical protein